MGLLWETANNILNPPELSVSSSVRSREAKRTKKIEMPLIYFGFCPSAINAWCKENNIIRATHAEKGRKSFQNGNSRGKRGKEKNVLSRTMGLIYSEGKFVNGMTIPMRLSDGWKHEGKNERKSEWNQRQRNILKDWFNFSFDFSYRRFPFWVFLSGGDDVLISVAEATRNYAKGSMAKWVNECGITIPYAL